MTKLNQIYKCNICGNIVEVLHRGKGQLVCCGQPMELMVEKTHDEGMEKHVPAVEKIGAGIKVKVGEIAHPMEEEHFIEWIEAIVGGRACRKFLNPGDSPEAEFEVNGDDIIVRAYCSVHGLWLSHFPGR
jgi:superoxide reductase